MKTTAQFWTALVAAFALNGTAFAAQYSRPTDGPTPSATAPDDTSMAWRMARYPFRVGHTVVRTPRIIGETFTGKRNFIGERGFFQSNDQPAAEERKGAARGKGQRMAR